LIEVSEKVRQQYYVAIVPRNPVEIPFIHLDENERPPDIVDSEADQDSNLTGCNNRTVVNRKRTTVSAKPQRQLCTVNSKVQVTTENRQPRADSVYVE